MKQIYFFLFLLILSYTIQAQQTVGVFEHTPDAFNGYTLIAPMSIPETILIDNCGRQINSWPNLASPGLSAYLLDDGRLLRTNRISSGYFGGGGTGGRITIQDWEGNVEWDYIFSDSTKHQHHDIEYMPNGNMLILAWEYHSYGEAIEMGRNPNLMGSEMWTEQIIEVKPMGFDSAEIVWEWHLKDHLIQDYDSTKMNFGVVADHPELINFNFALNGAADWMHFNSVDYNPVLDQIMVDSRHVSELYIIDHSTSTVESASHSGGDYGKGGDILYRWGNPAVYDRGLVEDKQLFGPHDCHWIPEGLPDAGKIMIFNNGQGRPEESASTVDLIEIPTTSPGVYTDPGTAAYGPLIASESYPEIIDPAFYSINVSGAQRLPNGNTLICEGASGHIFEVTKTDEIVWDYINPLTPFGRTIQGEPPIGNAVFRVYRYAPDYSAFIGRDLSPGELVEIDTMPPNCGLIDAISDFDLPKEKLFFQTIQQDENLRIKNPSNAVWQVRLIDLNGRLIYKQKMASNQLEIPINNLATGLYFLSFMEDDQHQNTITQKVLIR